MNVYEGYDCVTSKPDIDDIFIAHYGVKGMKWHKRLKARIDKYKAERRQEKYAASKIADDLDSKRRTRDRETMYKNLDRGRGLQGYVEEYTTWQNRKAVATRTRPNGDVLDPTPRWAFKSDVDKELKSINRRKKKK